MRNKIFGFNRYLMEKKKTTMNKFDQLIKDLENLNSKDNEDVRQAIATLKRGRDLKEYQELVPVLKENIKSNPDKVINILEKLGNGGK